MDNTIIIISSSVVLLGAIVFLFIKIQDVIKSNKLNKDLVIEELTLLSNKMDELENENSKLREQSSREIIDTLRTNIKSIDHKIALSNKGLISNNDKTKSAIFDELNTTYDNLVSNINKVKQDTQEFAVNFEKYQIDNKNQLENSFQNTVRLVNNLRLDNLINVSNEIGKYKNGIVEDEYFLQEVGSCKIIKFTDKQSNEVTEVYYNESGEKSHTQTFLEDKLKYEMKYTDGKLSNGVEYNEQGQIIFAYEYDEAGEVSTKIEYAYDKSGKQKEISKIKY